MKTCSLKIDLIDFEIKHLPNWDSIQRVWKQKSHIPVTVREIVPGERYELLGGQDHVVAARILGQQFVDVTIMPDTPRWRVSMELASGCTWSDCFDCELKDLISAVRADLDRCTMTEYHQAALVWDLEVRPDLQKADYFLQFAGVNIGTVHVEKIH